MAYIYKITNSINDKVYIGKTEFSIQRRFTSHKNDSSKLENSNRPLYQAMNLLGKENFSVELIEETLNPDEQERYWIEYYNSKEDGYNATTGGQGRCSIDINFMIEEYNSGKSIRKLCVEYGHDKDHLSRILRNHGVRIRDSSKKVNQLTLNGTFIKSFNSITEAVKELNVSDNGSISSVCRGKRKTAFGYKWEYI